ncbi:MAG: hydrogenase-4 component E, partial [Desulfovibrionaceae bacterium]
MSIFFQIALIALLLNNFALLAVGRMRTLIGLVAFQGVVLTGVLLLIPRPAGTDILHVVLLACALFTIKAVGFPYLLRRTLKSIAADHYVTPYLGFTLSVLAGMAALVFSLWLESRLPMTQNIFPPLLLPAALTTLFTGLTMVVGRMKALTQVIGY